jgi:hypothetical protein
VFAGSASGELETDAQPANRSDKPAAVAQAAARAGAKLLKFCNSIS